MTFLSKVAINGYSMGDVYSALQKSLRKGDESGALYWGCVLGVEYPNALKKKVDSKFTRRCSKLGISKTFIFGDKK